MVRSPASVPAADDEYKDIADYAIIGDLHTAALVSLDGSIDWMCYPHFDSPSLFGALLDHRKGGRFRIRPLVDHNVRQLYLPETNVLVTRFMGDDGMAEVTDCMPVAAEPREEFRHRLIRRVTCISGTMRLRLDCQPAFDYARQPHRLHLGEHAARFATDELEVLLRATTTLEREGDGAVCEFTLREGESHTFLLERADGEASAPDQPVDQAAAAQAIEDTAAYWRAWVAKSHYTGRWRDIVHRSALVLKLLTSRPTGATVAAPTTSLPEKIGSDWNWDYRYVWMRDAAFTMYGLLRIGFTEEAGAFLQWLQKRCRERGAGGIMQPVYRLDGSSDLPESTLDHLEGYRGSRPVRIGNRAAEQFQLDFYGAILDAAYLYNKHGEPIGADLWDELRGLVDWVCENWHRDDQGIWEIRTEPRPYVYSKMMCWVAIDRGIRLAMKRSFPAPLDRWRKVRDEVYQAIMEKGYDEETESFVHYFGARGELDAANLLMPLVFFLSPTDRRMRSTIDAIRRKLAVDNLVYRFSEDITSEEEGVREGTFSLCSFWLVEALTRAGQVEEARYMFEKMLGYANHVWLYAEEVGDRGQHLGNFPQTFTHLALISAAYNLDRALDGR